MKARSSPIATMKTDLTKMLAEHTQVTARASSCSAGALREGGSRGADPYRDALRAQDQKTPRGGLDYEQAVADFLVGAVRGVPCVVDVTGNTLGNITRCKKGDVVVRFTDESAFGGAAVGFEATRDASYTAQKAPDELDAARKNRSADVGVFVRARGSRASRGSGAMCSSPGTTRTGEATGICTRRCCLGLGHSQEGAG